MAEVNLTPVAMNAAISKGSYQAFASGVINSLAGTPVNLSAWIDLQATAVPLTPNPTSAPVTFGTVTGASTGILTLVCGPTDFAANGPGTARMVIRGKAASGDDDQILASGTLTLTEGA